MGIEAVTLHVLHVALWVDDWEPTRSFYVEGLGLTQELAATIDGVDNYLLVGPDGTGIQFKHDPEARRSSGQGGLDHVAVAVADLDAAVDRLTASYGGTVRRPPSYQAASGNRIAFVEDPSGYVVELVEDAGDD